MMPKGFLEMKFNDLDMEDWKNSDISIKSDRVNKRYR